MPRVRLWIAPPLYVGEEPDEHENRCESRLGRGDATSGRVIRAGDCTDLRCARSARRCRLGARVFVRIGPPCGVGHGRLVRRTMTRSIVPAPPLRLDLTPWNHPGQNPWRIQALTSQVLARSGAIRARFAGSNRESWRLGRLNVGAEGDLPLFSPWGDLSCGCGPRLQSPAGNARERARPPPLRPRARRNPVLPSAPRSS